MLRKQRLQTADSWYLTPSVQHKKKKTESVVIELITWVITDKSSELAEDWARARCFDKFHLDATGTAMSWS